MNPDEKGRMCDQCCKVVVDFTKMSNKGISDYLKVRTEEKVCGRFKTEQVAALPKHRIRFSFEIKRFAAALFLAFGSFLFASCSSMKPHDPEIMGDVAYIPDSTEIANQKHNDSLMTNSDTVKIGGGTTDNQIYTLGEPTMIDVKDSGKKVAPNQCPGYSPE